MHLIGRCEEVLLRANYPSRCIIAGEGRWRGARRHEFRGRPDDDKWGRYLNQMPTLMSGILGVDNGANVGDDAEGLVVRKGIPSIGKCSIVQTSATLNWNSIGGAPQRRACEHDWS